MISLSNIKRFLSVVLLAVAMPLMAEETDSVFYCLPNSGINLEALYSNPAHGTACVRDFNEDGYPDIIVTGPTYNDMEMAYTNILINESGKGFARYDLGMQPVSYGSVDAVRVGTKKWIVVVQGCTEVDASQTAAVAYTFTLSCTTSKPRASSKKDLANGAYGANIHFVDFNNDGAADIVQYGTGRKLFAYLNNGSNTFTETDASATGLKAYSNGDTKVVDMDNDGADDLMTVTASGVIIYHNNQDGTFTQQKATSSYKWNGTPRFDVADLDADGYKDLVAFSYDSTKGKYNVVFFWGSADGLTEDAEASGLIGVDEAAVAIGDFNKNGHLDVAYAGVNKKVRQEDTNTVNCQKAYILTGDGQRHFIQHVKWNTERNCPDIFSLGAVKEGRYYAADFDGDGYNDVLAMGYLGLWMGGKNMRYADLYYTGQEYGWGEPMKEFAVKHKWEGFAYNEVSLGDGRLKQAMEKELRYLKSLDINRLYASTLSYNYGINDYTDYIASGYDSSFSHWTSALAMAYAQTGDEECLSLVNRSIEIMRGAQDFNGDGFFAFKDGTTWAFDKMAKYKVITPEGYDENGHPWGNNGIGIPWFAHHKILAAMRDAYLYTDNEDARIGFLKFCDWVCMWVQNFDEENMQKMLESEHGGVVEVLSDAYALSGHTKYLDAAEKFTRKNWASTMSTNNDDLAGRHSNFHVPMAVGAAVNYHYTGNQTNKAIGRNFFFMIKDHHSLANGSHGNNERIGLPDNQTYQLGVRGPETCSSYNMLKLAKEEFMQTGRVDCMDFYENLMYNHILASLSTTEGEGVTYHMSLKPGTFKCYDNLYGNFWCCVGTSMENHMKYVDAIYFHNDDDLLVNIYTASNLNWKEKGLKMTMTTTYPAEDKVTLNITENNSFSGALCFRYPEWAKAESMSITVNGAEQTITAQPGELVRISSDWKAGDEIVMTLPAEFRLVDMPDDINVSALFYGPVMMGASLGEVGQNYVGMLSPDANITNPVPEPYFPSIDHSRSDLASLFSTVSKKDLKFRTKGLATNYSLRPFYDIHDQRYNVYWKFGDADDLALEKTIVTDHVIPGDADNESAHNMQCSGSGSSYASFSFWGPTYFYFRDATADGYIQYDMNLAEGENTTSDHYYLQVTYFGSEPSGYGDFKIYVDGTQAASVGSISYLAPLDHKVVYYSITPSLTKGKNKITVKLTGGKLSIYGLRLMKTNSMITARKKLGLPVASGIDDVEMDDNVTVDDNATHGLTGVYTLIGQKLSDRSSLPKGIYIQNGKKVVK